MERNFSSLARSCLRAAGWREGRSIRTDHWESLLRSAGNPIHPAVITFLRELGGLKVVHPHWGLPGEYDNFHLSPSAAMEHFAIEGDGLYDYNDRVGKLLCAIGTSSADRMLLMMDIDGIVYTAVDDLLFLVGNSDTEVLEALCADIKLPPIP